MGFFYSVDSGNYCMDDITVISGDGITQMLSATPAIYDRFCASRYFIKMHHDCEGIVQPIWCVRAALAEFKAAVETVASGLSNSDHKTFWRKSQAKTVLEACPLTKTLGKVRDLAFHTSQPIGEVSVLQYYIATVNEPVFASILTVFFAPLVTSRETKKSGITSQEIDWFNRQSKHWPACNLIEEAWYLLAVRIGEVFGTLPNFAATR